MVSVHEKSKTTIFLDILRNLLILAATGYIVLLIWKFHWIVALLAAIPVYIIMMNLIGFLTLPLYSLTPESRLGSKAMKAFLDGDFEKGEALHNEFRKEFNVYDSDESLDEQ